MLGQMAPVASIIKILLERRCIPVSRLPVFDTTPPGVGGRLKPRVARHGNFTPPRFSPSRPQAGVSLCSDEVVAKQLVQLFCGRMGTALHLTLAVFYAEIPHRWSWRILQSRSALVRRFVRERISVAGYELFKVQRKQGKRPPHCVGSKRAFFMLLFQKIFYPFNFS